MTKKPKRITLYTIVTIAVSILFSVGYVINEHLNALNWNKSSEGRYDEFDYLLTESSESFIFALFIILGMVFLTKRSLSANKKNPLLILSAWLFFLIVIASLFDLTFGSWGIPGRCGDGFSLGNCFLAEGLGELIYYAVIPIGLAIGAILLTINRHLGLKKD